MLWSLLQIAISNPNPEVLLTLSKSKVVELIGKEWYFVRVHDAVQVCLQQLQSLNESPETPSSFAEDRMSFLQRLHRQRDDPSIAAMESGDKKASEPGNENPRLSEPLLSRKQ